MNPLPRPRVRFLVGPAGSGKTRRCLDEIRARLSAEPGDGPPLLFLAPKQATFQLERQLLEDPALPGWSRLQIVSFERFSRQLLAQFGPVQLLDEEGRVMVLRAILRRAQPGLRVFHSAARLTGFAQEVSQTLRDLQRRLATPERLQQVADELEAAPALANKMRDLALLLREYQAWLRAHNLADADILPDLAADALRQERGGPWLDGLWLDGFAEMTPQEVNLLGALVARSREATLAFCADQPYAQDAPWLSTWAVVSQTFRAAHARLAALGCESLEVIRLSPDGPRTRFADQPALARLEREWSSPAPAAAPPDEARGAIRCVACATCEEEASIAAREIWRGVRNGLRFRDFAVLLRSLEGRHDPIRRAFIRYGIPFFIDRRLPLAQHPLAELSRSALRLAAFGWTHEDWFSVLKTGLAQADDEFVDSLENEALARGWQGDLWRRPEQHLPPERASLATRLTKLTAPFLNLIQELGATPSAEELVAALRGLWERLGIEATLERWSRDPDPQIGASAPQLHQSAREEISKWLDNLARGFGSERLPLNEWLPILEAGLATLTAGTIPPARDQVLIGAIDRSRQPEIHTAIVLGLNEGVFPAPPPESGMFTSAERDRLSSVGIELLQDRRRRIGHERYYGYIAFTRPRRRLVLTWAERAADGKLLNPSPFLRHIQRIFPSIAIERAADELPSVDTPADALPAHVEHRHELLPWMLARGPGNALDPLWRSQPEWRRLQRDLRVAASPARLSPGINRRLYGSEPTLSVSALESLAACPFQFFVRHGLRARERELFEVDARRTGSLAHDLLARFHQGIVADGLRWRDISPDNARERFNALAAEFLATPNNAFAATPQAAWQAQGLLSGLRELVAVLVGWAACSDFDPELAEVGFGPDHPRPAWRVDLGPEGALRVIGKADRIDVFRPPNETPEFLVMDYKLRAPDINDDFMVAGVDLQLAAYALAFRDLGLDEAGLEKALPAGMFYIGLRARRRKVPGRSQAAEAAAGRAKAHMHRGRFRESAIPRLDRCARTSPSGQYAIRLKNDGGVRRGTEGRPDAEFDALLDEILDAIRTLGTALLRGEVEPGPYRKSGHTPCERCDFLTTCRFDPWTQEYRRIPSRGAERTTDDE